MIFGPFRKGFLRARKASTGLCVRIVFCLAWLIMVGLLLDAHQAGIANSISERGAPAVEERAEQARASLKAFAKSAFAFARSIVPQDDIEQFASLLPGLPSRSVKSLDSDTVWAMETAATRTGISFDYLLNMAHLEADFDPLAKSSKSSAAGLFQFIEQTWLGLIHSHGAEYGWASYGDQISCGEDYCRANYFTKRQILDLRYDPVAATFLAAEFTRQNRADLDRSLKQPVTDAHLYLAHVLGAGGAVRLLKALAKKPGSSAATMFPEAANANRALFYGKKGVALTVEQFYKKFERRWIKGLSNASARVAMTKRAAVVSQPTT